MYQRCLCVCAQYKVLHYQLCPALRVNAECISGTCTLYRIVHLAHIAHTVSIVVTPLHAIWCRSQYFGRRVNEYSDVVHLTKTLQILQNSTLQVPCTKAALCLGQQLFNTLACQEAALHFNHSLPMLFVSYSFQFIYIIVLCTSLCLRSNTCTYWN